MKNYKIDMEEYPFPILLTKAILYNLILQIGRRRGPVLKIEAEALVGMRYIRYLSDVFRSNPEFFAVFRIPPEDSFGAEAIYHLLLGQFRMLTVGGSKCFEQVNTKKQAAGIRYVFKCSANFYQVCRSAPGILDLSCFV